MSLFYNFVLIPWLCALLTATSAAPLGSLISWRRLIYFGEALAHASLLGIALSLYCGWPLYLGIWLVTFLIVILLYLIKRHSKTDPNNILGSLAHLMLALGLIAIAKMENIRTDLMGYLFGDILSTRQSDLLIITSVSVITLLLIRRLWQPLILQTLNSDIAKTEDPKARNHELLFLLIVGIFVGIMVQFLGMMLVMAFLILPVQTANPLVKTPEQCVLLACLFSAFSTTVGVWSAYRWDLPLSPAIVAFLGGNYLLVHLLCFLSQRRKTL